MANRLLGESEFAVQGYLRGAATCIQSISDQTVAIA